MSNASFHKSLLPVYAILVALLITLTVVGRLGEPQGIELPGTVTALGVGEFRAADGFTDIAVGVSAPDGESLIIFDGAEGPENALVRYPMAEPVSAIELGDLDDDPFQDVAVASAGEILVVHGWGRRQGVDPASRIERISLGVHAHDIAIGSFLWNRAGSRQIAVRSDDGTVNVIERADADTRPFTAEEISARSKLRLSAGKRNPNVDEVSAWEAGATPAWRTARTFPTDGAVGGAPVSGRIFQRAHISTGETDDLVISDVNGSKLNVVGQTSTKGQAIPVANDLYADKITADLVPAAFLALPRKLNGWRDLVTTESGTLSMIPMAPTATITVDRTDDPAVTVGGIGAAACTAALNDCSLRGAAAFANSNPGTVISLGSNTYLLSTSGSGGCVIENATTGNRIGDNENNADTTIMGACSLSTIIRQAAATNDRVLCFNVPLAEFIDITISGLTITGGRDASGIGGGGFIGGDRSNTMTLSGVRISNNQTTGNSIPGGGGGLVITGGDLTITNCTIGGPNAPGADRTNVTLANSGTTSGGGIGYTPSSPGHTAGTGTLTVTGTTFDHNTAAPLSRARSPRTTSRYRRRAPHARPGQG